MCLQRTSVSPLKARAAIRHVESARYFFAVARGASGTGAILLRVWGFQSLAIHQKAPPGRFLILTVTVALSRERVLQAEGGSAVNASPTGAHTLILVVAVGRQA